MSDPFSLTGKRILVTGASATSDIGSTIAQTLAGAGAALILTARGTEALEATRASLPDPDKHTVAPFDLSDMDAIPAWMKALAEGHGPLDGVVHSASHQGYSVLRSVTKAEMDAYMDLNVGAALALVKGLRQKGVAADTASVVFIGSAAGLTGQKARSLYAASKAALISVTKSLALEVAAKGVRVNTVAPAVVMGSMAEKQFALLPPEQKQALDDAHPLGYGQPEDVARAVQYLMSPAARWITGTTLAVDGGFTAA